MVHGRNVPRPAIGLAIIIALGRRERTRTAALGNGLIANRFMRIYDVHMNQLSSIRRKATNISLDSDLLEAAKALGVNISRACERGLAEQVSETRAERWLQENKQALESSNDFVEQNGLPLASHRQF